MKEVISETTIPKTHSPTFRIDFLGVTQTIYYTVKIKGPFVETYFKAKME